KAEVAQIDIEPLGLAHGMKSGDLHLAADAKLAAAAILRKLPVRTAAEIRSPELARRIKEEPADATEFPIDLGTLDPRRVIAELDRVIPKDFDSVSGSGHQSYFHSVMRAPASRKTITPYAPSARLAVAFPTPSAWPRRAATGGWCCLRAMAVS